MYTNKSNFFKTIPWIGNSAQKPILKKRSLKSAEPVGIIPRSLFRVLNRFLIQLFQNYNKLVLQEFRISRYQLLVSIQSLMSLIFIPLLTHYLAKTFILTPVTEYLWNQQQEDIFLNSYLEKEALIELKEFEQQLYFDYFISTKRYETPTWAFYQIDVDPNSVTFPTLFKSDIQNKTIELANKYNKKSIEALTNIFGDVVTLSTIAFVIFFFKPQMIIFKSFLIEFIYGLNDTLKSAIFIFVTNLLVGFHSPRGWELLLALSLNRFGFPPNELFISFFVATIPVFLDTIFKYWVFRYLNRISPSTVATYHAMIE